MTARSQSGLGRTFRAEVRASPQALMHKEFGMFTVQKDQLQHREPGTVVGDKVGHNGGQSEESLFWLKCIHPLRNTV